MRKAATILLALAIAGSALAMGSVDTVVLVLVVAVLAAAGFLAWHGSDRVVLRRSASIIVVVALGLILFTALQCVPMPAGAVAALSPHAADVWSRALRPFGEAGPTTVTLSVDPTATRVELIRGIAYLLTFLAALRVAWRREGAMALERALVAASLLVTLVAALHDALGLEQVYGFYRPRTDVTSIAPLLNTNHLSAYANIALILCFASLLSPTPMLPRPLLAAAVLLQGAAQFWYASRGGVGAMIVGMLVVGLLRASSKANRVVRVALPASLALAGVAMLVLGAAPGSLRGLVDTDISKLDITRQVFTRMVPAYPWFGSGRGSFEQAFPEFRQGMGFLVWSHPENILAQWSSEWGLPVSALALGGLAYALAPRSVMSRSRPAAGPWAVLIAMVLHNMVDFSMEIPAVSIALAVCAALVVAGAGASSRKVAIVDRWGAHPKLLAFAALPAAVVAVCLALVPGRELLDARATLRDLQASHAPAAAFRSQLRLAMLQHPAEPYFPYVGAVRELSDGRDDVVVWIGHVLERAPIYPPAHLVLARWLRRRAPAQARLEYRLYVEQSLGQRPLDVREVAPLVGSFDDAVEAVPAGPLGVPLLEDLSVNVRARIPATQARIDAEILRRDPEAIEPLLRATQAAVADVASEPWCEPDAGACTKEALALAHRAELVAPERCAGFAAHARLLYLQGETQAALDMLRKAGEVVTDRAECQQQLAQLATEAGRYDEATSAIDQLSRTPCGVDATCVDNLLLAAGLEDHRGNSHRALALMRRAAEAAPDNEGLALQVAGRAAGAGLHTEAFGLYSELARRHPSDAHYRELADAERPLALTSPR